MERETTLHFHKFTSGAAGELSLKWDPVANSGSVQRARASSYYGQRRPLHISDKKGMEERRRGGFRVKPSFGQVLGYIQEGEPLALDLPNRKASIYTSSHFYLDDYPNAPEPVSETPLPHTTLNPAAAFETADEGYDGEAHVQRGVLRLREPQGGLALEADGPERGLAVVVGRQLRQLRLPGEPVPQELPLDPVVLPVRRALSVPLPPLLVGPVALRGLLPEALLHLLSKPGGIPGSEPGESRIRILRPRDLAQVAQHRVSLRLVAHQHPLGPGPPPPEEPQDLLALLVLQLVHEGEGDLRFRAGEQSDGGVVRMLVLRQLEVQLHLT